MICKIAKISTCKNYTFTNRAACVVSVEIRDDGSYGAIKIVAGNKAYVDSIERETPDAPKMLTNKFIPDSDYQCYFPKESFPEAEIFRAGGDEFMVLVRDTTEAYLIEKAKEIKAKADATENVRFATGVYFDKECNNIHNAMKIADGKMYEDKKLFYDKHPELRRPAERL